MRRHWNEYRSATGCFWTFHPHTSLSTSFNAFGRVRVLHVLKTGFSWKYIKDKITIQESCSPFQDCSQLGLGLSKNSFNPLYNSSESPGSSCIHTAVPSYFPLLPVCLSSSFLPTDRPSTPFCRLIAHAHTKVNTVLSSSLFSERRWGLRIPSARVEFEGYLFANWELPYHRLSFIISWKLVTDTIL